MFYIKINIVEIFLYLRLDGCFVDHQQHTTATITHSDKRNAHCMRYYKITWARFVAIFQTNHR